MTNPVANTPELVSPLLAQAPLERSLTHQASGLQKLYRKASDREGELSFLERKLDSVLLSASAIEPLLVGPLKDETIGHHLRQTVASPPHSEARHPPSIMKTLRETNQRKIEPGEIPAPQAPLQSPLDRATITRETEQRSMAAKTAKEAERETHTIAPTPTESSRGRATVQRIPNVPGLHPAKPKRERTEHRHSLPPAHGNLDAQAAGQRLAARAHQAGIITAWHTPLSLISPEQPEEIKRRKALKNPLTRPTVGKQVGIESHLEEKLAARLCAGSKQRSRTPPPASRPAATQGPWPDVETMTAQYPERPYPVSEQQPTDTLVGQALPAAKIDTAATAQAPSGLRGLAALATGPIETSDQSTVQTETVMAQQEATQRAETGFPNGRPDAITAQAPTASAAEFAQLLNEEARRAGIDVDEVGP